MGTIRNIHKGVQPNGDVSTLLSRNPARDREEGWSVVVRPYRPQPDDSLLEDAGCETSTCLLAGNRVLMADGSLRPIETIVAGDRVQTMSGPAAVREVETTRLGMTRKAIELRGRGDEALIMSDDHLVWVSRRGADGSTNEWWGTYNFNHTLFELRVTDGSDLAKLPTPLNFDLPEQVAHVSGWIHLRPIYHHLDPATELFHLVVESGFSYIAEGFPVLSHCLYAQGPATPWRGLAADRATAAFVDGLALAD